MTKTLIRGDMILVGRQVRRGGDQDSIPEDMILVGRQVRREA